MDFLSQLTHELRNPCNKIQLQLNTLKGETDISKYKGINNILIQYLI